MHLPVSGGGIPLLLAAAALLPACGDGETAKGAAPAPEPPAVVAVPVRKATVPLLSEYVARTEAENTVEVRARVEGVLLEQAFKEGTLVKEGDLLFRVDPAAWEAELAAARAALAKAEADLVLAKQQVSVRAAEAALAQAKAGLGKARQDVARLKPLAAEGAVPQQDLDAAVSLEEVAVADVAYREALLSNARFVETYGVDAATAAVASAKSRVALAELDVGYCTIRSPLDGLAGIAMESVGDLVGRGDATVLVSVSSVDPMRANFSVPEAEYLRLRRKYPDERRGSGPEFRLVLADGSEYEHPGTFELADRAVNLRTGTLGVVASFPNPKALLREGQFARVRFSIEVATDAVLVPQRAVFDQQSTRAVYVVGEDGKAALRTLDLGPRVGADYVVLKGLEGGEKVVLEGIQKVRPGLPVRAADAPLTAEPGAKPPGKEPPEGRKAPEGEGGR
jgi:membrane fusion protein (multidrug efflux system)